MNSYNREDVDATGLSLAGETDATAQKSKLLGAKFKLPAHGISQRYNSQHQHETTFREKAVEDLRKLNNFQYHSLNKKSAF